MDKFTKFKRVATTAERLRVAMDYSGKKQIDLVNETGLNKSTISRYLHGEYEPKQDAIYKLSIALDCSEMWLWGYDVPKERPIEQKKHEVDIDLQQKILADTELMDAMRIYYTLSAAQQKVVLDLIRSFRTSNADDTIALCSPEILQPPKIERK